jgi:polar amino acid transport system substrate-binding protein
MKFFTKIILIFLTIIYSLQSFSETTALSGIQKILDKGEIVVSITPNNTSMFTEIGDDGSISGIDKDIAEEIAKNLGVKLRIITTARDWNSVIEEVSTHKSDIGISYLSITAPRAMKVLYSTPYAEVSQTLVFNNLSGSIQKKNGKILIKDMFKGHDSMSLGVYSGSSYEEFAHELFPYAKLKGYETSKDMFDAVLARKVDAILIDELEVFVLFLKEPAYRLKLTQINIKNKPDYISIAIDPQNEHLHHFINNFLLGKQIKFTIDSAYSYSKMENK